MKRIFMIGMSIFLCLVMMVTPVSADTTEGTAAISSATGDRGATVELIVSIDGFENASSISVTWEGLSPVCEESEWLLEPANPNFLLSRIDEDGAMWAEEDLRDLNGDLLKLRFLVPDGESTVYPVTVTVTLYSGNSTIDSVTATGYVRVTCTHENAEEFAAEPSSCTEAGHNQYFYCNDCQLYLKADKVTPTDPEKEILPLADHDYEWIIDREATELAGGWRHQECKNCDATGSEEAIPILPHTHNISMVPGTPATCTKDGTPDYWICDSEKCKDKKYANPDCTQLLNTLVIPATGHDYKAVVTPPTCEADGYTTYTCSRCGDTYTADEVAALEHAYSVWQYNASNKTHTRVCRHDATHTETKNCSFDAGVVVTEPAVGKAGTKKFTCTVCGGSYTESIPALEEEGVQRIFGSTRYETSIEIANQLKERMGVSKFNAIVVASGVDFADALSGAYLANQKGAPILLVRNRSQEMTQVKNYIKANLAPGGTVYLLGGDFAVPKAMETGLDGFKVKRLGGATRYETNLLILQEGGVKPGDDILICTGKAFPDSLAASAVNKPILLVKDSLNANQKAFLNSVKGGKLYIISGPTIVSAQVETALKAYGTTQRLFGATRYHTSVEIAKIFFPDTKKAVIVNGENFPDGMCAGTLAYSMGAPILLTSNSKSAASVSYTTAKGIHSGLVIGGTTLISDSVVAKTFG